MARVISAFSDRLTGRIYLVGDDYQGSDERIAELAKKGKVESQKRYYAPRPEKPVVEDEAEQGEAPVEKEFTPRKRARRKE